MFLAKKRDEGGGGIPTKVKKGGSKIGRTKEDRKRGGNKVGSFQRHLPNVVHPPSLPRVLCTTGA